MSALELFTWCLYAFSTSLVALLTVIQTLISDDSLVVAASIIAFNIIGGAAAYSLGRCTRKHVPDQTVITQYQTTAASSQKPTLSEANEVTWWDKNPKLENYESKLEDVAQEQVGTTISTPENQASREQQHVVTEKHPVMTWSEKKGKIAALKAERQQLDSTSDEESWQHSELLLLSTEADNDYFERRPDSDAEALKAAMDAAQKKFSASRRQLSRKNQRLARINLDIKALER